MAQLGSAFYIWDAGGAQNNNFTITVGATTTLIPLTAGGYAGDDLATHIVARAAVYGYTIGCAYSETDRTFKISAAFAFDIGWNSAGTHAQALAQMMGYDHTADDTGASTYKSDDETYIQTPQWIGWDLSSGLSGGDLDTQLEAIHQYATNIGGSSPKFQLFGSSSAAGWLGEHPSLWSTAAYKGGTRVTTQSTINDLYVWGETQSAIRYLVLFCDRGTVTQATVEPWKIGVFECYIDATFDAVDYSRNFKAPWSTTPVNNDTFSIPGAGGGMEIGKARGRVEGRLTFAGWGQDAFTVFESLWDRYGREPGLWMIDPDDVSGQGAYAPRKALYGFMESFSDVTVRGTAPVYDWNINLTSVPMQPTGVA